MFKIGLTGTIGTGKSFVASILKELGAFVVDTDEIARKVVEPDTDGWKKIIDRWGKDILNPDSTINRKKLGEKVFSDDKERRTLNSLLHPLIIERTFKEITDHQPLDIVVLVVPLLFETGFDKFVDDVLLVVASEDKVIDRICKRDNVNREYALKILASQMPQIEKIKASSVVINNDGIIENTIAQVKEYWAALHLRISTSNHSPNKIGKEL